MITILGILLTLLSGSITTLTLSFCLTPKYPRKYSLPIFLSLLLIVITLKNTCGADLLPYMVLLSQFLLLIYLLLCYSNHILTIVLSYASVICFAVYPIEYIAIFIMKHFGGGFSFNPGEPSFLLATAYGCLLEMISHILYYILWHRFAHKEKAASQFTFMMLPLLWMLLSFVLSNFLFTEDSHPHIIVSSVFLIIAMIISVLVLFMLTVKQREKDAAEAAYEELKLLHELDNEYYAMLEERTEELARIRHDIHNQFITINILLNSGKLKEAEHFTIELLERISSENNK